MPQNQRSLSRMRAKDCLGIARVSMDSMVRILSEWYISEKMPFCQCGVAGNLPNQKIREVHPGDMTGDMAIAREEPRTLKIVKF